jgi:hypothetical protein
MKQIIVTLAAFFLLSTASAQRKQLGEFTNDFGDVGETFRIGLSFVPLRIASWFVPKRAFDGEAADIKWALKKVKSLKLYAIHMPEGQPVPAESVALLKEELKKAKNFEPLMEVRHKGSLVHLLTDGEGDERLDNLVVLIQDEEEMLMVHLRTKMTVSDVSRIVNRFQEKEKGSVAEGSGMVAQQ